MNQDRWAGMWKQLAGSAKEQWGELTDNPLVALAGTHDRLAGRILERYGVSKEHSARQPKASRTQPRLVCLESVKVEANPKPEELIGVSRSIGVGPSKVTLSCSRRLESQHFWVAFAQPTIGVDADEPTPSSAVVLRPVSAFEEFTDKNLRAVAFFEEGGGMIQTCRAD